MDTLSALKRAICLCGGGAELARKLRVSPQAVWKWQICPAKRVLEVERATGGKVTRHELRPDLYPIETGPHTSEAEAVPTTGDGYRPVGAPADAPPPCDEAGRERVA